MTTIFGTSDDFDEDLDDLKTAIEVDIENGTIHIPQDLSTNDNLLMISSDNATDAKTTGVISIHSGTGSAGLIRKGGGNFYLYNSNIIPTDTTDPAILPPASVHVKELIASQGIELNGNGLANVVTVPQNNANAMTLKSALGTQYMNVDTIDHYVRFPQGVITNDIHTVRINPTHEDSNITIGEATGTGSIVLNNPTVTADLSAAKLTARTDGVQILDAGTTGPTITAAAGSVNHNLTCRPIIQRVSFKTMVLEI